MINKKNVERRREALVGSSCLLLLQFEPKIIYDRLMRSRYQTLPSLWLFHFAKALFFFLACTSFELKCKRTLCEPELSSSDVCDIYTALKPNNKQA